MKFKDYLEFTRKTVKYNKQPVRPEIQSLLYLGVAYAGEVGETANEIKKVYRDNLTVEQARDKILDELGDSLWYATRIADELGTTLEKLMSLNKKKLENRLKRERYFKFISNKSVDELRTVGKWRKHGTIS